MRYVKTSKQPMIFAKLKVNFKLSSVRQASDVNKSINAYYDNVFQK